MSKRVKIRFASYIGAAVLVLLVYSSLSHSRIQDYRLATQYSSKLAFAETVNAVEEMSEALEKSLYATDGSMCGSICAKVYAESQAAEAALAVLPFSTQELEQISGFVGVAGDYAYTLCREAAAEGFTDEQRKNLSAMSGTAAVFARTLRTMQDDLYDGFIKMDDRERKLANVETEEELSNLSSALSDAEGQFPAMEQLSYDGRYSREEKKEFKGVSEEKTRQTAAELLGVSPEELKLEYEYEGGGRRCYSSGSRTICVDAEGVESISDSRLVSEKKLDAKAAEQTAEEFLKNAGYENMQLSESWENGAVLHLRFVCKAEDAACLDRELNMAVALDDGSIYSFDSTHFGDENTEAQWTISKEEAEEKLPQGLKLEESGKVTLKSPGGKSVACYELKCKDEKGRDVRVYINAETGRQQDIVIKDKV